MPTTVRLRRGGQSFDVQAAEQALGPLRPRERAALRRAVSRTRADARAAAARQAKRDRAARAKAARDAQKAARQIATGVGDAIAGPRANRLAAVVEGLARIGPRPGMENVPAEQNRVRNARIRYSLEHQDALNEAKRNPLTKGLAAQVEAASFALPGGGGLLQRTGEDLVNTAIYALPSLYETGKAAVLDAADTVRGKPTLKRTGRIAKQVGEGFVESAEHPLRHPGFTALNAAAVFSGGASAAARASAAAAAREAGAGAAARAALRKPVPAIRKVRVGDAEFQGTYSKNPGRAVVQRQADKRAARLAGEGRPGRQARQAARFGKRQRIIEEDAARAVEITVAKAGRKLTAGQQMALRAVVEQTPLDHRLALVRAERAKATDPKVLDQLDREAGLIEAARPYVTTTPEGRVIVRGDFKTPTRKGGRRGASPGQLQAQVDRVVRGGERRERQGVELGLLDPAQLEARRNQPAGIAAEAAGAEPQPALGYLGYGNRRGRDMLFSPFQSRTGARPKPSPELAGSLKRSTGRAQRTGAYQHDTPQAAATGFAAMNRLHLSIRNHARLYAAGVDRRPASGDYLPIREGDLSPQAMATLKALSERAEDLPLSGQERAAFDRALAEIEPRPAVEALDAPEGASVEGVRWVPRALFEKVSQVGQVGSVPTHHQVRMVRAAWHEAMAGVRALVLYAKGGGVGYILPNMAANVLLLGFQGGPKALRAAARSLDPKFRRAVGEDAWSAGLARMGEGRMVSTFAEQAARGPIGAIAREWANLLGKVTDEPTRMAALVYEAAQRGYRTPQQFKALMTDPRHADDAMDVTIRARDAALDYGLMSPPERSLIASWLFVYPFIRASIRYAINYPADHPVQAAVLAQLADIARQDPRLGERGRGYDAGLVQVGERDGLPLAANANALSPFATGPELVGAVGSTIGVIAPQRGEGALDMANPLIQAGVEMAVGRDSFTGRPVERNLGGLAGQIAGSLPPVQALRQWRKTPEQLERQVSPRTHADVVAQQALGSLAPKPYDVAKAESYRKADETAKLPPGKRARRKAFQERELVYETMRANDPDALEDGRLPAPVRQAYNRLAEVQAARAKARADSRKDSLAYYRQVAVAEARLYERWGVAPKGFAADVERRVGGASLATVKAGVTAMRDHFAPAAYRDVTAAGARYLERNTR